ncbi:MAG TPA: hypothetical protein DGR08_09755 [Synechococcales bacterium UBA12195]|nr:hypothetical protein [Synechococcales bacterium UBA12195]
MVRQRSQWGLLLGNELVIHHCGLQPNLQLNIWLQQWIFHNFHNNKQLLRSCRGQFSYIQFNHKFVEYI